MDITTTSGTFIADGFVVHNCGPSGKLLNKVLDKAGFYRSDTYVTNATLCRATTDNDAVRQRAVACCAPRLARELVSLDPEKKLPVLTLGKWAAFAVLGIRKIVAHRGFRWVAPEIPPARVRAARRSKLKARAKITRERTADRVALLEAMSTYAGRVVVPSVHSTFVLRSELWEPVLRLDVSRVVRLAKGEELDLLDQGDFELGSSDPVKLRRQLSRLGPVVAVDIESAPSDADLAAKKKYPDPMTCKVLCVGLSDARPDVPRDKWVTIVLYPFARWHGRVLNELFHEKVISKRSASAPRGRTR